MHVQHASPYRLQLENRKLVFTHHTLQKLSYSVDSASSTKDVESLSLLH